MYPILFEIGSFKVQSYYVFWIVALYTIVLWGRQRASARYGISQNDFTHVMIWVVVATMIGARIGGYFDFWSYYAANPDKIWQFWEGAVSSGPGMMLGGLVGILVLKKKGISLGAFADAVSLPVALGFAIGRIGCFLNGCCSGIACSVGVAFPGRPELIFPSQAAESVACFVIFAALLLLEKKKSWDGQKARKWGAYLWPVFMILYGSYRLIGDIMRDGDRILGLRVGQYSGAVAVIVGILWLRNTLLKIKTKTQN